jgi:hypothetical protein
VASRRLRELRRTERETTRVNTEQIAVGKAAYDRTLPRNEFSRDECVDSFWAMMSVD